MQSSAFLSALASLPRTAQESVLRLATGKPTEADLCSADPCRLFHRAGMTPDPWQETLLRSPARNRLLVATRQAGKSTTVAALALTTAITEPGSLIPLLSPTLRQSGELFRDKVLKLYNAAGQPVKPRRKATQLELEMANGSRIVSLPESEAGVRGFSSVALLVIDEASRVSDDLYRAVRPMLAVSGGKLVAMTTPFGKRGWYFEEWDQGQGWERCRITADLCPRITADFLAAERRSLGERFFRQEYFCSFEDNIDQVFSEEDIRAAFRNDLRPLFGA